MGFLSFYHNALTTQGQGLMKKSLGYDKNAHLGHSGLWDE